VADQSPRWRRRLGQLALLGVAVSLVIALVTDLQAHARDRHAHAVLASAEATLGTTRTKLASTSRAQHRANEDRRALLAADAYTRAVWADADQKLAGANQAAFFQGLDIGSLQTCLGGVKGALAQIANHDNTQAGMDLSGVSPSCETVDGGNTDGLAYPFDFPDPFVLMVGGTYYAYATNSVEGNIQIIQSSDRTHWTAVGNALPNLPSWATPNHTWAPAVLQVGGQYVLYYTAQLVNGGPQCISAAVASQPQGPFIDTSAGPFACQPTLGGSIDPSPFVNADGTPYLVWKSTGEAGQPTTIWSQQLDPAGTGLVGTGATPLLIPDQSWEGGNVEAPDLVLNAGRYFLFYSGNDWNSAHYAIGVASCSGPLGPCTRPSAQPILASGADFVGPGGASVFTDQSGGLWIAFHAWSLGAVGYPHSRDLFIRPLNLAGAVPVIEPGG
jgi:hypothetical protein